MNHALALTVALDLVLKIQGVVSNLFNEYLDLNVEFSDYQKYVSDTSDFSMYDRMKAVYVEKTTDLDSKILLNKIKHNVVVAEPHTKFCMTEIIPMAM